MHLMTLTSRLPRSLLSLGVENEIIQIFHLFIFYYSSILKKEEERKENPFLTETEKQPLNSRSWPDTPSWTSMFSCWIQTIS